MDQHPKLDSKCTSLNKKSPRSYISWLYVRGTGVKPCSGTRSGAAPVKLGTQVNLCSMVQHLPDNDALQYLPVLNVAQR